MASDKRGFSRLLGFLMMAVMCGCGPSTSPTSEEITRQFQSSGRTFVNLGEAVSGDWERVCIFGPYSDNKAAQKSLGISWDLEKHSSIASNDGIALLVFVKGKKVVEHIEHSRKDGDFTNLSRKCFQRDRSTFYHQTNPKKGWPGLFPRKP